ncbi:MAG TPA: winged helix-turn-helix domain-containing protein [Acetobacteraceae bacterium]|nr:winged helix-turn-helix domain-containing protein [Acetobacteraceae bacterium]
MRNDTELPDPPSSTCNGDAILFGDFCLVPAARMLTKRGEIVPVGDRALDLLIALVNQAGQVVSKADLFAIVWPRTSIIEGALRVHIAALRKVLGDGRAGARLIVSVRGRGYAFVAQTKRASPADTLEKVPEQPIANLQDHVPAPLVRIIGRDEVVAEIVDELPRKRLVTITGTGGMGKTVVALAVMRKLANFFRDGVALLELSWLGKPDLVTPQLASLLHVPAPDRQPLEYLISHVRRRHMLIVFDNCEHVIETISPIAEAILQGAPQIHILATSREPLRALGERVYRLVPLAAPPASSSLTAAEALKSPAVQLFAERAWATNSPLDVTDPDAPIVAEICTRLDGLPLAIELAAARLSFLGLRGLADRLDDRFQVLTKGRRTALPRHRTLAAMIDWSYDNLDEEEKRVWRGLAIFPASFSIEAADTIARLQPSDDFNTADILDSLVEKSVVTVEPQHDEVRYRLLESLRLYALNKLFENKELEQVRRRHAEYSYRHSLEAGDDWAETPTTGWRAKHGNFIADVRAALEWAFGLGGDPVLGIKIIAASARLWFRMLLLPELRGHLELAIKLAPRFVEIDDEIVMRLHIALAISIFHTDGSVREVRHALDHALAIAERCEDVGCQLEIIWTHCRWSYTYGDYRALRPWLNRGGDIVSKLESSCAVDTGVPSRSQWSVSSWWRPELPIVPLYDRIATFSHHLLGEHEQALQHAERARADMWRTRPDGAVEYDHEHEIAMRQHHARLLWIVGRPDQAWQMVQDTIDTPLGQLNAMGTATAEVLTANQSVALGFFLVYAACPIAFWIGDLETAGRCVSLLLHRDSGIDFHFWQMVGHLYERVLAYLKRARQSDPGVPDGLTSEGALFPIHADSLSTFHWRLLHPHSLCQAENGPVNWCTAEILRARGEALLGKQKLHAQPEAEQLFLQSIEIGRKQKALSWELRSATSLARLWHLSDRTTEARNLLSEVYGRFTEGFATKDLAEAKELLDVLG